jgi:Cu/Ag efflux protein CusF
MKYATLTSLFLLLFASSGAAMADEHQHGKNHHDSKKHAAMNDEHSSHAKGHHAEGTVNKIDLKHGKINLTHGPIKSLGWSGMTMDFSVKDTSILKTVKAGQKVTFKVVKEGPGEFFITRITAKK